MKLMNKALRLPINQSSINTFTGCHDTEPVFNRNNNPTNRSLQIYYMFTLGAPLSGVSPFMGKST